MYLSMWKNYGLLCKTYLEMQIVIVRKKCNILNS